MIYYSAFQKDEILTFVTTWIDLEGIKLREISDRKKQTLYDFTHRWNIEQNKKNQRQT